MDLQKYIEVAIVDNYDFIEKELPKRAEKYKYSQREFNEVYLYHMGINDGLIDILKFIKSLR